MTARPQPPHSEEAATAEVLHLTQDASAILLLPSGTDGRAHPLVVVLPDADGPGTRTLPYSHDLLQHGIALLLVDVVNGQPEDAPPLPLAAWLPAALAAVAGDMRLDLQRVGVLGLGQGARAALLGAADGAGARTLALLYPGCDPILAAAARQVAGVPRVLLLHGDEDAANDPDDCATVAGAFAAPGAVRHRVLDGSSYGWDAVVMAQPGVTVLLPHPAEAKGRIWCAPSARITRIAAAEVAGFLLSALQPQ